MALEGTTEERVKGRVLFTGNKTLMIDDLMNHLPDVYETEKCPPSELDFIKMLEKYRPHVVVVCLSNETKDALGMYTNLQEDPLYTKLPVLVIGHEEECILFKQQVAPVSLDLFGGRLDRTRFLETLGKRTEESIENEKRMIAEAKPKQEEKKAVNASVPKQTAQTLSAQEDDKALVQRIQKMLSKKSRKSILVVDDDVTMLNLTKLFLEDLYDITVVPSGKLAIKFLLKNSADLVLLDYMMPEMDGPAVLKRIRECCPNPNIPVIFLTGVDDKDMVMRGLEFRPSGYLLKPVTRKTLLEKVTEILLAL